MSEARRPHNKTDIDEQFIIDNYTNMTQRQIADYLGVSRETVNHRAIKLGLRKTSIPYTPLEKEEIKVIEEFPNYGVTSKSRVVRLSDKTLIKPKPRSGHYPIVVLFKNGVRFERYIHRLVALNFIPNPENKQFVNHVDGNKDNFSIENLEWVTPKENYDHAVRTGLIAQKSKKVS
ncbi:HNH endonuclease [Bacillus altitudinis]|uniref:HNH endonuclease n=1 Tax=Bacillus altitudinis TaxID=293387 RepID=UPI0009383668|nr:HNH endonuclease [Bacillus altitudinis]APP15622.1 HNH endonuclease [Bacillus altitudinis]